MKTTTPIVRPGPDPLSQPFWDAAAEHRLVLQRCGHCDRVNHPPQAICGHCGAAELTWTDSDGRGTVYSWTSVLQRPGAGRGAGDDAAPTPDTVLVVAVGGDPDALLVGRTEGRPDWVELGAPTRVVFRDVDTDGESDDPGHDVVTMPDFVSAADDA